MTDQIGLLVTSLGAFVLCVAVLPFYIKFLKKRQLGQVLREEGPASHAGKRNTPTMGGLAFMLATTVTLVLWWIYSKQFSPVYLVVLATAVGCGVIGMVDDLAKILKKHNSGISARIRLLSEFALGTGLAVGIVALTGENQGVTLPSAVVYGLGQGPLQYITIFLPAPIFVLFASFVTAACANAVNLHDGMDGLAAGTGALVFASMTVMLLQLNQVGLACIAAAAAGGLVAFLLFNRNPASIFMGDTGSLFLGGLMAALTMAGGLLFFFVPLSAIYIAEAVSVMMQVTYFKLTKAYEPPAPLSKPALIWLKLTKKLPGEGKRLFRMAPLHHHFEAVFKEKKIDEWQVVAGFWMVQAVICLIVLSLFFFLR